MRRPWPALGPQDNRKEVHLLELLPFSVSSHVLQAFQNRLCCILRHLCSLVTAVTVSIPFGEGMGAEHTRIGKLYH